MVASRSTMEVSPGRMAREMANNMVRLAEEGQWSGAEHIAARLRSAVLEVPGDERHDVMTFVNECLERAKTKALSSRNEVTTKMAEVRRGRNAAKAYGSSLAIGAPGANDPHATG